MRNKNDYVVYYEIAMEEILIIGVYADDTFITGSNFHKNSRVQRRYEENLRDDRFGYTKFLLGN